MFRRSTSNVTGRSRNKPILDVDSAPNVSSDLFPMDIFRFTRILFSTLFSPSKRQHLSSHEFWETNRRLGAAKYSQSSLLLEKCTTIFDSARYFWRAFMQRFFPMQSIVHLTHFIHDSSSTTGPVYRLANSAYSVPRRARE